MNQDMPLIYPKIKGHAVGCEAQLSFLQYFVRKLKAKLLGWLEILSQAVLCSPEAGSANYCWIVSPREKRIDQTVVVLCSGIMS